jgi:hypothetical protein
MINYKNKEAVKECCQSLKHNYHIHNKGQYVNKEQFNALIHLASSALTGIENGIKSQLKLLRNAELNEGEIAMIQQYIDGELKRYEKYKAVFEVIDGGRA